MHSYVIRHGRLVMAVEPEPVVGNSVQSHTEHHLFSVEQEATPGVNRRISINRITDPTFYPAMSYATFLFSGVTKSL